MCPRLSYDPMKGEEISHGVPHRSVLHPLCIIYNFINVLEDPINKSPGDSAVRGSRHHGRWNQASKQKVGNPLWKSNGDPKMDPLGTWSSINQRKLSCSTGVPTKSLTDRSFLF